MIGARGERALRALLRLYPEDFRDEMGEEWLAAYRSRAARAGRPGPAFWLRAVADSVWNGVGERLRPAVTWRRRGNWGRDTQRAARRLVRSPGFTLATVGTLAVGLGSFAVVWSVVDNVLLEAPAYERPGDLYYVWRDYRAVFDLDRGWLGGPDVVALDSAGGAIAGAVAVRVDRMTLEVGEGGEPRELAVMRSGAGLFELLGVRPALGRGFAPEEEGEGREPVVVLGHELWRTTFAADPAAVGREVRLNGEVHTIIGVMPETFRYQRHSSLGPPEGADLYATFGLDLGTMNPGGGSFSGLVRAVPGTTPERMEAEVAALGERLDEAFFDGEGIRYYPVGLFEDLVAPVRPALLVVALAGVFLVLVLAVNLATLLLGRAAQREREMAVSRALGADRWTIARATVLEGGLLGLLGAGAGLALAVRATTALAAMAPPDLPRRAEIAVDARVAGVVLAVGLALGLLGGALPALWASRSDLAEVLRQAAVRGGSGGGRLRRGMVVVQIALSLVLLSAGGVLVRSLGVLFRTDPGFEATGALTFRVPLSSDRYPDGDAARAFHDRFLAELRGIPGVTAAGGLSVLPLTADADQFTIGFPGAPGNTGAQEHDEPLIDVISATEGALDALGARLLDGRLHDPAAPTEANEVLIDHTLAETFYPGRSAVGGLIMAGDDTLRIVGVIQQPRLYDVHRDSRGQLWPRNRDYTYPTLSYVVRGEREPMSLVGDVRAALHRIDPSRPLAAVRPIDELVGEALRHEQLSAGMVAGFALAALLLSAMGLSGIVSSAVTRRRAELGIRMALGADAGRVLRMVLADGLALVGIGILIAVPGVWAAGRLLRGVLVGVSPFDLLSLTLVALGLTGITALACWIPARRVTGIDPARSLRSEQ